MDNLAALINKSFQAMEHRMETMESGMAKQEDLLALSARVDKIEKRFEKYVDDNDGEFKAIHKKFDIVFAELKEIRKQLNKVDTRAEVLDLQVRLGKLEGKIGM